MNSPLTPSAMGVMCPLLVLALWRLIGVAYNNCPPCNLLRSLFRLVREIPSYLMASWVGNVFTDILVCVIHHVNSILKLLLVGMTISLLTLGICSQFYAVTLPRLILCHEIIHNVDCFFSRLERETPLQVSSLKAFVHKWSFAI